MNFTLPALGLSLALALGVIASANAADLINEDDIAYTLMINGDTEILVEPGDTLMAICESCELQILESQDDPIKVMEETTVVISEGKLLTQE